MKRNNFTKAESLVGQLKKSEDLLQEITEFNSWTGDITVELRRGKEQLYITAKYESIFRKMLAEVSNEIKLEIKSIESELETL